MNLVLNFPLFLLFTLSCSAGPLEDLANMPDLTLFYQQLVRQQDITMFLQNMYPQQQPGGMNDFTIFAPTNEAMARLTRKNEDLNLLWKYHIVSGRYDEQMLFNMAQEKFGQVDPRQMANIRPQNNLATTAIPFQVFVGLGFYGGSGPQANETYDNAGYGYGGISWLAQTSVNQTNIFDDHMPINPNLMNNYNPNQNHLIGPSGRQSNNFNSFPQNLTNYYTSAFTPNMNPQLPPNAVYNPYLQQQGLGQMGPGVGMGVLRPTINNAFVLQSRPMSRGIINVIDSILWPPERRDPTQYRTAYDALEDAQFSRLRQLAERSDYFRSELRSMHHQTWFLPNDQAFASMGSSLSSLLDQTNMNSLNEINEFVRAHVIPLVIFPSAMDSTKQVATLSANKWVTFRKVSLPEQSFQIDVVSNRHVARILISRPEEIRLFGNGVIYPISSFLSTQTRSAADELQQSYQYFFTLVQQSGDLELMNILQAIPNQNIFNPQNSFNVTVLIPQQSSIQHVTNPQELAMHLRRHILRYPVYTDQLRPMQSAQFSFLPANMFRTSQQQQQQKGLNPSQNNYQTPDQQQQLNNPQQNAYPTNQQQQQQQQMMNRQQNTFQTGQQFNPQQNIYPTGQQQQQQPLLNPQQNIYSTGQQQQQPIPQQNIYQTGQQQQQPIPQQNIYQTGQQQQQPIPQQNIYQTGQQQQQQPFLPQQQQLLMQPGFNQQQQQQQQQQQFQMPQFQQAPVLSDKKLPRRRRRQPNTPLNTNFQSQQFANQQILPNQQQQIPNQQQQASKQQMLLLPQQQPMLPNQQGPPFDPNLNQFSQFPSYAVFRNGETYPTMDPQFTVQAQVSTGPNGNVVTLVGRSPNSPPFSTTILNSESNIQVKNGVMHVIRGILSGAVVSLEGVLSSVQGANVFAQLLQQTGVINQLRRGDRPYTLFIPTNAALQSINPSIDINRLRQFVLRHICADVLLDPTTNILRRSAGFYNQNSQQRQRPRQKRQDWMNNRANLTNRQGPFPPPDLGPGYFQPQQQAYGGFPAAPSSFGSNNQMYNPGYAMNNYPAPTTGFGPPFNGTAMLNPNMNYNNMPMANVPLGENPFNRTMGFPFNPQGNNMGQNFLPPTNTYQTGAVYTQGPQSCLAMTGDRITVQSLAGTQPEGNTPSMSYQNFMITCCGDQSVNSLVQSFNVYPPNFAVYLIGRSLLAQGQTINNMYNHSCSIVSCHHLLLFIVLITSILWKQIQHFY